MNDPDHRPDVFAAVGLIGTSAPMLALRREILRAARSNATVLVTGETGTGKELVARALHAASPRAKKPFVAVNVATLRNDLVASELFGHERGAFTGALSRHRGVFEQAHGGTLFLDEIGELDPHTQADLLRVLEAGEIRPVGSERTRAVDVRVVAATHRDLFVMVSEGRFREDLFYRLDVLRIAVPALRERRSDIPALVAHLSTRIAREGGSSELRLTDEATHLLTRHTWPGNARELVNVLRRAAARSDGGAIDEGAIRAAIGPSVERLPPLRLQREPRALDDVSIAEAIRASGGNISAAARRLGIARSTLRDRLGNSAPFAPGRLLLAA